MKDNNYYSIEEFKKFHKLYRFFACRAKILYVPYLVSTLAWLFASVIIAAIVIHKINLINIFKVLAIESIGILPFAIYPIIMSTKSINKKDIKKVKHEFRTDNIYEIREKLNNTLIKRKENKPTFTKIIFFTYTVMIAPLWVRFLTVSKLSAAYILFLMLLITIATLILLTVEWQTQMFGTIGNALFVKDYFIINQLIVLIDNYDSKLNKNVKESHI